MTTVGRISAAASSVKDSVRMYIELATSNCWSTQTMQIDLHGYHPNVIDVRDLLKQAWEIGAQYGV